MKNRKIYYYKTYADDLVKSRKQDYKLKDGYKWIHNNTFYNICSSILYFIAYVISYFNCKIFLHMHIKNSKILNKFRNIEYKREK